ncbi:MAG: LysM peptidoglycan-binding domain-containing protein [Bacteroidota bacterium]
MHFPLFRTGFSTVACFFLSVAVLLPASMRGQVGKLTYLTEADGESSYADSHKVQAGETLYGISRQYGLSVESLKALNGLENNIIHIGQRLLVSSPATRSANQRKAAPAAVVYEEPAPVSPETESVEPYVGVDDESYVSRREAARNVSAGVPAGEVKEQRRYHEVQKDENIYTIAEKYEVLVAELREWNALSEVRPGQTIIVDKSYVKPQTSRAVPEKLTNLSVLRNVEVPTRTFTAANARTTAPTASETRKNLSDMRLSTPPVKEGTTSTWEFDGASRSMGSAEPAASVQASPVNHPLGQFVQQGTYAMLEAQPAAPQRFYAAHKDLPRGTRVNIDLPNNSGFLEVEITGKLSRTSQAVIGLSPDAVRMLHSAGARDQVRFYFTE